MGEGIAQPEDQRFMAAAIRLSRSHTGRTSTNPSVGCVIVRDGVIVGRAVTALGGRPHAEPQALAEAGELALQHVDRQRGAHSGIDRIAPSLQDLEPGL